MKAKSLERNLHVHYRLYRIYEIHRIYDSMRWEMQSHKDGLNTTAMNDLCEGEGKWGIVAIHNPLSLHQLSLCLKVFVHKSL